MIEVSLGAAWSSGTTGMAFDTDIDARPTVTANRDAAIIFMSIPFDVPALKNDLSIKYGYATSPVVTVPMAVMPVVMIPAAMPAPMMPAMMIPATVPAAVVPVMMMPADLHRLELVDLRLRHHGQLKVCRAHRHRGGRNRRQGGGLRACRKQRSTQHQPSTQTQKDASLHDFLPFPWKMREVIVAASI
jgi:hypothetical protein